MNPTAAMTLAVAFTQDPTIWHFHQCGRFPWGLDLEAGCGRLWQHFGKPPKSNQERNANHRCPDCGKGPFLYVLSIEELESAHAS